MSISSSPSLEYRADIDGLRAIAVLCVVAYHAFPDSIKGGFIGVDVFFVISGFLISSIIFRSLDQGRFSVSDFYVRRIRRILPALCLVLFCCLIIGWFVLLADELNQLGTHLTGAIGFFSNFVLWNEAGYFDSSAETKPLLHLWSLAIEMQFYALWPLLIWLVWRNKFALLALISVLMIISFYFNVRSIQEDPIATFYSPQTRIWELLCGSILAWYVHYKDDIFSPQSNGFIVGRAKALLSIKDGASKKVFAEIVSLVGCLLLGYGLFRISNEMSFPGKWAVVPVMGAVLIILAGSGAWINRVILSNRVIVWFGLISFPLYLWHWPILSFARVVENDVPNKSIRMTAVVLSTLLAWLTVKFIEKPFRSGYARVNGKHKFLLLCGVLVVLGGTSVIVSRADFTKTHRYENLFVSRKGFEHAVGYSLAWYEGREDWLFLGNAYEQTVAKLRLAITPTKESLDTIEESFSNVAEMASNFGVETILLVAPDKSRIYSEYLPDDIKPSSVRYSHLVLNRLKRIPELLIYDPTSDLLAAKEDEGDLYWRTDTHWNNKGAFVAFAGLSRMVDSPIPKVSFKQGEVYKGDLIGISKLYDFPLHSQDNWDIVGLDGNGWREVALTNDPKRTTDTGTLVTNKSALSEQYVWVVGDSFTSALKPYFNTTFKQVRYIGHWQQNLDTLPDELAKAKRKPDLIVVVRVERSF